MTPPLSLPAAQPPPAGSRILAAVSGGPDSTALLLWLVDFGYDVAVAHYDHGLRPTSADDADHVTALCERLGVPCVRERRHTPLARGSVQAAARALRYEFLARALAGTGGDLVCLGHTADDVVEGALLHLLRGTGLAGLRGMPARRGPFVRPLLNVWRADIETYLTLRGEAPLRDPANLDTARFARARVRHMLLPALERDRPGLTVRLHRAAAAAGRLQARLEFEAAALVNAGCPTLAMRAAPAVVRMEAYRQLHGSLPALSRRHLEAMDALTVRGRTGSGLDLPGGRRFRLEPGRVSMSMTTVVVGREPARLEVRPCDGCSDPAAAHLRSGQTLTIGHRRPGLRMRPVGSPGSRKLQDILVDARVPRHLRDQLPLVFADGRLAWVPGIAVDSSAAATPGEPAVHITLEAR
jgi:tRNA(Ile)-lysidine synthase